MASRRICPLGIVLLLALVTHCLGSAPKCPALGNRHRVPVVGHATIALTLATGEPAGERVGHPNVDRLSQIHCRRADGSSDGSSGVCRSSRPKLRQPARECPITPREIYRCVLFVAQRAYYSRTTTKLCNRHLVISQYIRGRHSTYKQMHLALIKLSCCWQMRNGHKEIACRRFFAAHLMCTRPATGIC